MRNKRRKRSESSDVNVDSHRETTFEWLCQTGSTLCSADWICYYNEDYACFAMLGIGNGQVNVRLSVSVSKILQVQVFENGKKAFPPPPLTDATSINSRNKISKLLDRVQKAYACPGSCNDCPESTVNESCIVETEFEVKMEMSPTTENSETNVDGEQEAESHECRDEYLNDAFTKSEITTNCDLIAAQDPLENLKGVNSSVTA